MTAVTLGDIRRMAAKKLAAALGPDETPALDARLLVASALLIASDRLSLEDERPVTIEEAAAIDGLLERRVAGEPVARIVGSKEFWGMALKLAPATLVPRPDTETVVEAALDHVDRHGLRQAPLRIVDIGTGSGAILLSLIRELPNAVGLGVDLAEAAVRTARENAADLGVAGRTIFVRGHWSDCCAPADVIVSNPPYIRSDAIGELPVAVRDHDPRLALDGGSDGLAAYRAIIADCRRSLAERGACFLEIGFDQADAVSRLVTEAGYRPRCHRDLAGHDRVIGFARSS